MAVNQDYLKQVIDKASYAYNLLHSGKDVQCFFALQGLLTMLENLKTMEAENVCETQQPKTGTS